MIVEGGGSAHELASDGDVKENLHSSSHFDPAQQHCLDHQSPTATLPRPSAEAATSEWPRFRRVATAPPATGKSVEALCLSYDDDVTVQAFLPAFDSISTSANLKKKTIAPFSDDLHVIFTL